MKRLQHTLNNIVESYWILLPVLLIAFLVRLHGFSNPIADWHSWRQADTSAVSRSFVTNGYDILHPRFEDISNVPSGKDNPKGYRFVEFPIYNLLQAGLYQVIGIFTLEEWGRLVTIFASLITTTCVYLLVRKYADALVGISSAFFYAVLPYSIYYGRVILPDTSMVAASMAGIYFFDRWLSSSEKVPSLKHWSFWLALLCTAVALLLKPYALFFTLPLIYLAFAKFGFGMLKRWQLWLFLLLSVAGLAWWRLWMRQYPEGIPASSWLFNGGNIRFKGAYFYWIFADRIGRLILGYWGLVLFGIGLIANIKGWSKNHLSLGNWGFFFSFLLSSLLYIVIIARGNVQHDYYQILIVPSLVIFMGIGTRFLLRPHKDLLSQWVSIPLALLCVIFSLLFGWYFVRDYFNINNPAIVAAGEAVDRLTPKNAKVIAPYDGDTSFLYQTKRQGWPSFEKDLPVLISMGADYLVLVNPKPSDYEFAKTYKTIASTPQYVIYNLRQSK